MTIDEFKKTSWKWVGPGGMNCSCCGPPPGKERKALRRKTRRVFKREMKKDLSRE